VVLAWKNVCKVIFAIRREADKWKAIENENLMSEYFLNEGYARSVNQEITTTAEDMLSGKLNFLLGARILASLSFKIPKMDLDPDFRKFIGIASESDDFPLAPYVRIDVASIN